MWEHSNTSLPRAAARRASFNKVVRFTNERTGEHLADARVASALQDRVTGLLNYTGLQFPEGLWLVPADEIHTVGMRFPIDVAFLDHNHVILAAWSVPPGFQVRALGAKSVLELPAGQLQNSQPGDRLKALAL